MNCFIIASAATHAITATPVLRRGPQHHPYGLFCVAPGHQLGFDDLKTIEVAEFLEAIGGGERARPDFREAWEIQKIIDTAVRSSKLPDLASNQVVGNRFCNL
jgi:predicted dehydrogenase